MSNRRDDIDEREAFFAGSRALDGSVPSAEESHLGGVRNLLKRRSDIAEETEEIEYSELSMKDNRTLRFISAMVTVLFVVGFLGACLYESYKLREEVNQLEAQCQDLENQIEAEKAKVIEYKVSKAYYTSDRYKEDMARNRFRLIYSGEILIQVTDH